MKTWNPLILTFILWFSLAQACSTKLILENEREVITIKVLEKRNSLLVLLRNKSGKSITVNTKDLNQYKTSGDRLKLSNTVGLGSSIELPLELEKLEHNSATRLYFDPANTDAIESLAVSIALFEDDETGLESFDKLTTLSYYNENYQPVIYTWTFDKANGAWSLSSQERNSVDDFLSKGDMR